MACGVGRYRSLSFVLRNLIGNRVQLQKRPNRYKFGCMNYGEVLPEWINAADNDKYDIFAPGYALPLEIDQYVVESIIGVLMLANKNHKIAVRIDAVGYEETRARDEIQRFCAEYTRRMRIRGEFKASPSEKVARIPNERAASCTLPSPPRVPSPLIRPA